MDDLISRKWLVRCVEEGWIKFDTEKDENRFIHLVRDIAPSAQPYTEAELQKMQDLEQAELDKAFELGKEEGRKEAQPEPRWIPCSERLPEVYEAGNSVSGMFMQSRPVLVYGVPEYESEHGFHVVTYCDDLNGITYWSTELDAVTINEVIAWMPLPKPYKGR